MFPIWFKFNFSLDVTRESGCFVTVLVLVQGEVEEDEDGAEFLWG